MQTPLSSRLSSKNLKSKIGETIILNVTLREEYKLIISLEKDPKTTRGTNMGTGRSSTTKNSMVIISRGQRYAYHVA